ncbi:histidine phosphatase family protein [Deinococcus sp. HMF7604]|uniref:histidine phosphatase family protein n=1 Tax=Deinococcus betulae TaxID=2873312 RepID=UPI001CC93291|nr:histidine phosphatase family protein [Deinococcus betulae]MBZ9753413.1 histidine phosphatase family protein [Deinococcus betulae]
MKLPEQLPPGIVLLVWHARAEGQAPDAALTPDGETAVQDLARALAHLPLTRIVSSPWRRAVQTAQPLAESIAMTIHIDERLTERVLTGRPVGWWRAGLRWSFRVPALRFPGGESGRRAQARSLAALADARDPSGVTVVVTHGNLMALALGLTYAEWAALTNLDVRVWSPLTSPQSGRRK